MHIRWRWEKTRAYEKASIGETVNAGRLLFYLHSPRELSPLVDDCVRFFLGYNKRRSVLSLRSSELKTQTKKLGVHHCLRKRNPHTVIFFVRVHLASQRLAIARYMRGTVYANAFTIYSNRFRRKFVLLLLLCAPTHPTNTTYLKIVPRYWRSLCASICTTRK